MVGTIRKNNKSKNKKRKDVGEFCNKQFKKIKQPQKIVAKSLIWIYNI